MAEAKMAKLGYCQIEPNRLTAQKTREVFAQLPMDSSITALENGMGLVYDQVAGKVTLPATKGARVGVMMNEIILEDDRNDSDRYFYLKNQAADNYQTAHSGYPRVYGLHIGDTFTTNCVKLEAGTCEVGDDFCADTDGYWAPIGAATAAVKLEVIDKAATLPDGQAAVKFVVTEA